MGEIINLRRARKAKTRQAAIVEAASMRALHGRSKAERAAEAKERNRSEMALDGAAIERTEP